MSLVWDKYRDEIRDAVESAKAITWDKCHKIYVLMDDEQVAEMRDYGYDPIVGRDEADDDGMMWLLRQWYEKSCGLRFIESIATNHEDPNGGFTSLIPQGADWEDE